MYLAVFLDSQWLRRVRCDLRRVEERWRSEMYTRKGSRPFYIPPGAEVRTFRQTVLMNKYYKVLSYFTTKQKSRLLLIHFINVELYEPRIIFICF